MFLFYISDWGAGLSKTDTLGPFIFDEAYNSKKTFSHETNFNFSSSKHFKFFYIYIYTCAPAHTHTYTYK